METRYLGRLLGSLIPAVLAGLATCAQWLWGCRAAQPASLVLPLAVPVGAILGMLHAGSALDSRTFPVRTVLVAALQAVVIGLAAVALITSFSGAYAPEPTTPGHLAQQLLVMVIYGIVLFGLPVYLATATFAAICALLGRWLLGRGRAGASFA